MAGRPPAEALRRFMRGRAFGQALAVPAWSAIIYGLIRLFR
jgi:hypothetical protein